MCVSNWCVLQGAQAARRRANAETCARRSGEAPVEAGRCEDDECYHGVTRVMFMVVFVYQLQVVLEWQSSVNERLSSASDPSIPSETPVHTEIPESGFHSPGERPAALDNSLSSTAGSPETVRSLGPLRAGAGDSLIEQYLCSVQRRDEESSLSS